MQKKIETLNVRSDSSMHLVEGDHNYEALNIEYHEL